MCDGSNSHNICVVDFLTAYNRIVSGEIYKFSQRLCRIWYEELCVTWVLFESDLFSADFYLIKFCIISDMLFPNPSKQGR